MNQPPKASLKTTNAVSDLTSTVNESFLSPLASRHLAEESIEQRTEPLTSSFEILSEIQEPGQIRVLKVVSLQSHQRSRIKAFQKERIPFPVEARAHFLQSLVKLDHPNVLKTQEVFQDEEHLYIITEDYDGGDLEAFLAVHTILAHAMAAAAIRQILSALAYCHGQGIVHGSINLKNILLTETPDEDKISLKLTGFCGNDYVLIGEEPPQTWFSAPETERGECSDKSDIWSCGVLLYVLLCGSNPFDSSRSAVVSNILKEKGLSFPPVSWGKTSHDILKLISSMISVDPAARPNASQCLSHPWILQKAKRLSLTGKKSLTPRNRGTFGTLKTALMHFLISRIMKGTEIARLAEFLTALDKRNDGVLSKDEILSNSKEVFSDSEEIHQILLNVERSSARTIEISEILLPLVHEKNLLQRDNLKIAYCSMALDENGRVVIAALQALLRISNGNWTVEQWKDLVSDLEGIYDTYLDFNGFRAIVMKVFRS